MGLVLEAEWKGFGDEYAVSGLEKVRADKAESLGGCGAVRYSSMLSSFTFIPTHQNFNL